MAAKVITVINRKGGVGKTTLAGNLAGELLALERRTAVLDLDPQATLTTWAGMGDGVLAIINRHLEPKGVPDLQRALDGEVQVAIIDTPPGFDDAALMAAAVAHLVLIPCGPSPFDIAATREAVELIRGVKRADGLPKLALVPARVQPTTLGRALPDSLAEFGVPVLPPLAQRAVLAQAALDGLTVAEFAPSSTAGKELRALASAVLEMLP